MLKTGLDQLLLHPEVLEKRSYGLLTSHCVRDSDGYPILDALYKCKVGMPRIIFSPQHGFHMTAQANMDETPDGIHPHYGIPIVSLYTNRRVPSKDMFDKIDILIMDIIDVGTRVYTFMSTMLLAAKVALAAGVAVWVLDRPNPIGRRIEGCRLEKGCESFVGQFSVPLRHGMTAGELLRMGLVDEGVSIDEVKVVGCVDYDPEEPTTQSWYGWPSPNMPTERTAHLYPGTVLFEGTNISEGRGTTRPFEVIGAPWLNPKDVIAWVNMHFPEASAGLRLVEMPYVPMFDKFSNMQVEGIFLALIDYQSSWPVRCAIALLKACWELYPDHVALYDKGYEYEYDRNPLDLISGTPRLFLSLVDKEVGACADLFSWFSKEEALFQERRKPWLLYPR